MPTRSKSESSLPSAKLDFAEENPGGADAGGADAAATPSDTVPGGFAATSSHDGSERDTAGGLAGSSDDPSQSDTAWIGGIPNNLVEGEISDVNEAFAESCRQFGDVISVTVRVKPGQHKSWALCTFKDAGTVRLAASMGMTVKDADGADVPLKVSVAEVERNLKKNTTGALAKLANTHQETVTSLAGNKRMQLWPRIRPFTRSHSQETNGKGPDPVGGRARLGGRQGGVEECELERQKEPEEPSGPEDSRSDSGSEDPGSEFEASGQQPTEDATESRLLPIGDQSLALIEADPNPSPRSRRHRCAQASDSTAEPPSIRALHRAHRTLRSESIAACYRTSVAVPPSTSRTTRLASSRRNRVCSITTAQTRGGGPTTPRMARWPYRRFGTWQSSEQ